MLSSHDVDLRRGGAGLSSPSSPVVATLRLVPRRPNALRPRATPLDK